jgi:hypothetical protein
MLRWLYIQLIRLHPAPFRWRFGDQMLDIFDGSHHDQSNPLSPVGHSKAALTPGDPSGDFSHFPTEPGTLSNEQHLNRNLSRQPRNERMIITPRWERMSARLHDGMAERRSSS